jgi:hypothetical protein
MGGFSTVAPPPGARRLSELIIDVDKDWRGYRIRNLGAPTFPGDVARKTDLDAHRTATPIDHPDGSITRAKLEYPTVDVSFAYLASINKTLYVASFFTSYFIVTRDSFADKAVWLAVQPYDFPGSTARLRNHQNYYHNQFWIDAVTSDHMLVRYVNGVGTIIAIEAVDLGFDGQGLAISCSGSTIKSLRYMLSVPHDPLALPPPSASISATDTSFASGLFGFRFLRYHYPHGGSESGSAWLKAPLSPLPPAQAILELDIEGSGKPDDPYRPGLTRGLAEVDSLTGLPDFLYLEAKRYQILVNKGFTEEEMKLVFGYVPQHQVDLNAVTWGVFELHPEDPTVIVTITGDSPYSPGAIDRQKGRARRVFRAPEDYSEATTLYRQLARDHPHWLVGKDNFAYQVLGLKELDLMQNVDFYYGELLEHKTHYQQLKHIPDQEIRGRLEELIDKLSKVTVLTDERDKHIAKAGELLRVGW